MLGYFKLQAILLHRHLTDFGFPKGIGFIAVAIAFVGIHVLIYVRLPQPGWVICCLAVLAQTPLSGKPRTDFLRMNFRRIDFLLVRLLEHALLAIPFSAALLAGMEFVPLLALALITPLLSLLTFRPGASWTLPTPFGRWPFEYVVGFRRFCWMLPLLSLVAYQAIRVQNPNLGVACPVVLFVILASFHQRAEHEHYVVVYLGGPARFLWRKIRQAAFAANLLTMPFAFAIGIAFPMQAGILLLVQLSGTAFVATWLLAKYAHYPEPLGLLPSLLILASLIFPPLMLALLPHFFSRARYTLSPYLQ